MTGQGVRINKAENGELEGGEMGQEKHSLLGVDEQHRRRKKKKKNGRKGEHGGILVDGLRTHAGFARKKEVHITADP